MGIADRAKEAVASKAAGMFGIDPVAIMAQVQTFVSLAHQFDARVAKIEDQNTQILYLLECLAKQKTESVDMLSNLERKLLNV